jgi:predicted HD superfamily hydrolase involved in NAD metabolism
MTLRIDNRFEEYLRKNISDKRFAHLKRCAETAEILCRRNGLDEKKGAEAALLHDVARECSDEKILRLAGSRYDLITEERDNPLLVHGKAAAAMIARDLGIEDEDILEAAACHTTGCPEMGPIARVVFIADYIEPGRTHITEEFRKRVLESDLAKGLLLVLDREISYLEGKGVKVLDSTRKLYREVQDEAASRASC